jgi:hypothetical protein
MAKLVARCLAVLEVGGSNHGTERENADSTSFFVCFYKISTELEDCFALWENN